MPKTAALVVVAIFMFWVWFVAYIKTHDAPPFVSPLTYSAPTYQVQPGETGLPRYDALIAARKDWDRMLFSNPHAHWHSNGYPIPAGRRYTGLEGYWTCDRGYRYLCDARP